MIWSRRHQTWAYKQGFIVVAKGGNWHNITPAGRKALTASK
jgi:hypothetical protein